MADDLTGFRDRQDRLEGRVAVLEVTVEREADLRAKMDSDLGEMKATLKAHERSLQAVHDTQSDHTRRLTRIEDKVVTLDDRLGNVEVRLGTVEEKLDTVRIGVHAILDLLDTHLAKKPRWARLAGLLKQARPRGEIRDGS